MKTRSIALTLLIALVSLGVLSCSNSTTPPPSNTSMVSGVGHVWYWSDGGGETWEYAATGEWSFSAGKDSITLHATIANGQRDTVRLVHGSAEWGYDSRDGRACYPMAPLVTETADSLTVSMSSGYTIDRYCFRKN